MYFSVPSRSPASRDHRVIRAGQPGTLIQTVSYQTGAVATGTAVIPNDDTIPQITEGTNS